MDRFTSLATRALVGAAVLVLASTSVGQAQVGTLSNSAAVTLNARKNPIITLTTTQSALTLAGGITDGSAANQFPALNVGLNWTLTGGSSLQLVGWFANGAQALANGTNYIPSSLIEGKLSTASTWNAFNGNAVGGVGAAGSSLVLENIALAGNLTNTVSRTVDLRLNLVGQTTVAGDYTGTLNLRAVVQ